MEHPSDASFSISCIGANWTIGSLVVSLSSILIKSALNFVKQSFTTIMPFGQLTGIDALEQSASYAPNLAGTRGIFKFLPF